MTVRTIHSRPESYDPAVSVGRDQSAVDAAKLGGAYRRPWLHDGVSEQGAPRGIDALKIDDRICGSAAARAEFLDVGGANDL